MSSLVFWLWPEQWIANCKKLGAFCNENSFVSAHCLSAEMAHIPDAVHRILDKFRIPNSKLEEIRYCMHLIGYSFVTCQSSIFRDAMVREFTLGLNTGSPPSSVAMLPTFIPALPDGTGNLAVRFTLIKFQRALF